MAVRKQRRMKTLKGRTINIKNRAHWDKVLGKSWSAACKRMRPFLSEVSRKPQFNHVTFAELDVGAEGTSELAQEQGVQALPTVQAWKSGKCIETVVGGTPAQLLQIIQDNAGERPSDGKGGGGLRGALRGLALGAAAAAAVLLAARAVLRARTVQDEAPGERMQRELRDLQRRIETLRKAARKSRRLGPKEAAERKERLRELKSREAELMSELHNTLGSSSAGRGNDDDSEDDDHEVTERLDRPAHADRPASAQHAEEGGEDDDESGEEEEEEGADARKSERGS